MMRDVFGLIYACEENFNLRDLVMHRSVAALPVGGRYRAIDFLLSNMVNSGLRNVGIITQKNYKSMMNHLGSGKEWDLSRKNGGLFFLPPFDNSSNTHSYRGMCDAIISKIDYLHDAPQQYCLLSGSYTIYTTTYIEMMRAHIETNADITLLYDEQPLDFPGSERFKDVRIQTDESGRVIDIERDSNIMRSTKLGMDIYLIDKTLLEQLLQNAMAHGSYNFITDVLIPNLNLLRVQAVQHTGYVSRLQSVADYYQLNMDILREEVRSDLFYTGNPVYTKIKDEPPVKYMNGSSVTNCLLGDGCEIEGRIENSVLFGGVNVRRNSTLRGAIVMQESEIGEDCWLENVIIDKFSRIRKGVRLIGTPEFPVIIRKDAVI